MYNVVRAKGKHTKNDIYNAHVIREKYGFTAEEITRTSLECQNKYGGFEHDPLNDPYVLSHCVHFFFFLLYKERTSDPRNLFTKADC